jgi:hypothetical protein
MLGKSETPHDRSTQVNSCCSYDGATSPTLCRAHFLRAFRQQASVRRDPIATIRQDSCRWPVFALADRPRSVVNVAPVSGLGGLRRETRATLIWVRALTVYHSPPQTKNDRLVISRLPRGWPYLFLLAVLRGWPRPWGWGVWRGKVGAWGRGVILAPFSCQDQDMFVALGSLWKTHAMAAGPSALLTRLVRAQSVRIHHHGRHQAHRRRTSRRGVDPKKTARLIISDIAGGKARADFQAATSDDIVVRDGIFLADHPPAIEQSATAR